MVTGQEDIFEAVSMEACVNKRLTIGAPAKEAMEAAIKKEKEYLEQNPQIGICV